jgi:hypothetical protein
MAECFSCLLMAFVNLVSFLELFARAAVDEKQ